MNELIIIITGVLGSTLTFYVSHELGQGPVRASALLSMVVALFFYCYPELLNPYLTKNIQIVFIGTSFIGMISAEVRKNYVQLVVAGALFSLIYIRKSQLFEGFGGGLGALAFITLLSTLGIFTFVSKAFKRMKILRSVRKRK